MARALIQETIIVLFVLAAAACGPVVKHPVPLALAQGAQYSQPQVHTSGEPYRIQPGDFLDVKFFYNPELNETNLLVRPDGYISLQLVQEVPAVGLTPAELRNTLKERYEATILQSAEVAVIVHTVNGQKVFVDGEVLKPGVINIVGSLTVLQAVAQAGGAKLDSARMNEVIIIRRGVDGKPITTTVNLADAIDGTDPKQDVSLMPYDIVYVPKSAIGNVDMWVDQYVRKMIPFPLPSPYVGGTSY